MTIWSIGKARNEKPWNLRHKDGVILWSCLAETRSRICQQQDVAFFQADNKTGFGMCIRGDEGKLLLAKTAWIEPKPAVKEGEA